MAQKTQLTSPRRLGTSTYIAVLAAAILATAPTWAMASDAAKAGAMPSTTAPMDHSKMGAMPSTMAPMDHSKMAGMKHEDCPMHKEGMSMTGDVDHDFAANMRMHHQMAVKMSQAEIKNGKNPQMVRMAKDIITAQNKEIVVLDKWLAAHKMTTHEGMTKAK